MADTNRHVIRKYTATSHVVTVYAGTDGSPGFTGDDKRASSAKLNSPIGIAIDFLGNVYFADTNNYRIRRVDWGPGNNRTITTIAGNGLCCWSGSSPTLVKSYLTSDIYGLAVTPYGTLYFPSEMKYSVRAMQVPTSGNLGTTCGNCYLPSSAGSLCCQNSIQIVAAHIALQLTYNSSCFEQCNPNGCPALCSASACIIQPSGQPSNQPSEEPTMQPSSQPSRWKLSIDPLVLFLSIDRRPILLTCTNHHLPLFCFFQISFQSSVQSSPVLSNYRTVIFAIK